MIARKPKFTEAQFLRGADSKRNRSTGSAAIKHLHFRMPDTLHERLREIAWTRRTNVNALMVTMLEEAAARDSKPQPIPVVPKPRTRTRAKVKK